MNTTSIKQEKVPGYLSVVMPVYNEAAIIETVVTDYVHVIDGFTEGEIVLVNDASTDTTWSVLQKLAEKDHRVRIFSNEKNMGHSPTLMRAYHEARGTYVFHVDSDNQFVANNFWQVWEKQRNTNADIVIGIRFERKDQLVRLILTRFLKVSLYVLFGLWLPDANSPFRLYRKEALHKVLPYVPKNPRLTSIYLTVAGYHCGLKTEWIPVEHLARTSGQSFIRSFKIFHAALIAFGDLMAFRKQLHLDSKYQ